MNAVSSSAIYFLVRSNTTGPSTTFVWGEIDFSSLTYTWKFSGTLTGSYSSNTLTALSTTFSSSGNTYWFTAYYD